MNAQLIDSKENYNPNPTLWLIDDDPALRLILEDNFSNAEINGLCIDVISFANAHGAWTQLNELKKHNTNLQSKQTTHTKNTSKQNLTELIPPPYTMPHAIISDIRMPMMDGLSFSNWLSKEFPDIPIIIMTAHSDLQSAIDSYQTGAFEYLPKPFDLDESVSVVQKAINSNVHYQQQLTTADGSCLKTHTINADIDIDIEENSNRPSIENQPLKTNHTLNHKGIIGQSIAMQNVFRAVGRLAHSPITVLITGESGTGKELVANALHQSSLRHDRPFIALNMSAIPHDLIESELFGHEKGAFTGATSSRQGRFEQADGGTLFLDEIGDMPFNTQTRLLRVLANGEFFRVGGKDPIKVDVRIISATHQNLEDLVQQGKFREDLFYRLNVIRLPLPPLRERQEDIPVLTEHFLQKSAKDLNSDIKQVHPSAMHILQNYHWSGNVRQLENSCRWLTVMTSGDIVYLEDLPPELLNKAYLTDNSIRNEGSIRNEINTDISNKIHNQIPEKTLYSNAQCDSNSQYKSNAQYESNVQQALARGQIVPHTQPDTWQYLLENWTNQQLKNSNITSESSAIKPIQTDLLSIALPEFEKVMINTTLLYCKGHKGKATQILGWGRNTLSRKIKQLGLDDRW